MTIFEQRTYTLVPGRLAHYVKIYAAHGLPVTERHGIRLAAYFRNELGDLNQVVHFWRYASAAERQELRIPRDDDPDWRAYQAMAAGNVVSQESRLWATTPFGPDFVNVGATGGERTIVEVTQFAVTDAAFDRFVATFGARALPAARAAGFRPLACLVPVSGPLNALTALWYWPDQATQEAAQAALDTAPDWQEWRRETAETIVGRNRTMLIPLWFSPLQ